ncbi:E3 ubiquitin-protein ligase makorin, partial [Capsicum annuum]
MSTSVKRVLCKFFVHGACLKGEYCEFSHDWKDPPYNVCLYYQKGLCAYGNRCRYKHVKVSEQPTLPSSSAPAQHLRSASPATTLSPGMLANDAGRLSGISSEYLASSGPFYPPNRPVWSENSEHHDVEEIDGIVELKIINPSDQSICSFAAAGKCSRGEKCPYIHGDLCPICVKHCLHPFRPQESGEHMKICEKRQKRLDLLKHSQEIECSVCLERVLSKTTAAERKFGILFECDHPFCISCIRNWRSGSPSSGVDINSTFRTCPVCRQLSYFVIPSVIWYTTKEEKKDILDGYKAKLRFIFLRFCFFCSFFLLWIFVYLSGFLNYYHGCDFSRNATNMEVSLNIFHVNSLIAVAKYALTYLALFSVVLEKF